ncbi:hypothetical protein ACOME3_000195 [Neoechinorhynchus agilis]
MSNGQSRLLEVERLLCEAEIELAKCRKQEQFLKNFRITELNKCRSIVKSVGEWVRQFSTTIDVPNAIDMVGQMDLKAQCRHRGIMERAERLKRELVDQRNILDKMKNTLSERDQIFQTCRSTLKDIISQNQHKDQKTCNSSKRKWAKWSLRKQILLKRLGSVEEKFANIDVFRETQFFIDKMDKDINRLNNEGEVRCIDFKLNHLDATAIEFQDLVNPALLDNHAAVICGHLEQRVRVNEYSRQVLKQILTTESRIARLSENNLLTEQVCDQENATICEIHEEDDITDSSQSQDIMASINMNAMKERLALATPKPEMNTKTAQKRKSRKRKR